MPSSWEQVMSQARLISLPEAFLELKRVLEQEDFSMADVALAISQDPALTARLLRLVNSPFYGLSGKIDTVFRAVTMIGAKQVYDLALATSVAQTFDNMDSKVMDMERFWRRSVFSALAAKRLALACDVADGERLFVAGLLHDIGHLVMYQFLPELCLQAIIEARESGRLLHQVERELCSLDYARVGGALMRQWQLPGSLRETTEFHVEPEKSLLFPLETSLVHIAVVLSDNQPMTPEVHHIHAFALETCGIDVETCIQIRQQAEQDAAQVYASLFALKKTA
jgi:HD-like signal output (HDOD) protein